MFSAHQKECVGWVSRKSKKTHKLIYTHNACGIAIFYRGFLKQFNMMNEKKLR
jgi:hypothetical protein